DHGRLNPEIGTDEDYNAFVEALHAHGLGQILDVVPNHVGVVGNENVWWNDVLENGLASPYAHYCDIAWYASPRPELQGKILLPVLAPPSARLLEPQHLRFAFAGGAFTVGSSAHRSPVAPQSSGITPGDRPEEREHLLGPGSEPLLEYRSILTAIGHLPQRSE